MAPQVPYFRLSAFYFAYFAILGVLLPYWPLYLQRSGYDAEQIGVIMGVIPATKIISPIFWGWIANLRNRNLQTVRVASFLAFTGFCTLGILAEGMSALLIVMAMFSFCWNATLPLFETVTLAYLAHQPIRYSKIRLWGSVGFILSAWVVGALFGSASNSAQLPAIIAALLALQWLFSLMTRAIDENPTGESQPIWAILKRKEVIFFFMAALLLQVSHGPYYSFYSLYLTQLGYSDSVIGQLWALGVCAEILLFTGLNRIHRYVSMSGLFLGALILSATRWLLIGWYGGFMIVLVIAQLLHAATFGVAHAFAIHFIHRNFRGAQHAGGQALYSGICYGVGGALGSFMGGAAWAKQSPAWVFTSAACFCGLAFIIAWWGVSAKRT